MYIRIYIYMYTHILLFVQKKRDIYQQLQVVNALTAKELYVRERQYLVRDSQVVVVDEFTGRPVEGRSWSDGLQQAIEAKEGENWDGNRRAPAMANPIPRSY